MNIFKIPELKKNKHKMCGYVINKIQYKYFLVSSRIPYIDKFKKKNVIRRTKDRLVLVEYVERTTGEEREDELIQRNLLRQALYIIADVKPNVGRVFRFGI